MEHFSDLSEYTYAKKHIDINPMSEKNDFIDYNTTLDDHEVYCDPKKDNDLRLCRQSKMYFPGYERMQVEVTGTQNPLCQFSSQEQADFDYGTGIEYVKPQYPCEKDEIDKSGRETVSTADYDCSDSPQYQQEKSIEKIQPYCPGSPTLYSVTISQSLDPQNQYQMTVVQPDSPCEYQQIQIKIPQMTLPPVYEAEKSRKKRKTETASRGEPGVAKKKNNTKIRADIEDEQAQDFPEELMAFFCDEDFERVDEQQNDTQVIERQLSSLNFGADSDGCSEKLRNKKSAQNHRRNGPGLTTMRSRASQSVYFDLYDQGFSNDFAYSEFCRVRYIGIVIHQYNLTSEQLNEYKTFVRRFQLQRKTWKNVSDNLGSNRLFASIFVSCIIALLSPAGENDFEAWMRQGDMSSGKVTLREDKAWFRAQFIQKFAHLGLVQV